jgi:hypothetical protein
MIRDQDEISIKFVGDFSSPLADKLQKATMAALELDHKLPDSVRLMSGMSGKKYRYLINNLISFIRDARYLEVGSWKGSTACAAMHGNTCKVTCIDDWSHHGTNNQDFFNNTKDSLSDNIEFTVIEKDFRQVEYGNIGKYNVYFFDGPHEEIDQYDGVVLAQNALDFEYILIVDDYNFDRVRKGTQSAIKDLNLKVLAEITVLSSIDGDVPKIHHEKSEWHNGYYFAVIRK